MSNTYRQQIGRARVALEEHIQKTTKHKYAVEEADRSVLRAVRKKQALVDDDHGNITDAIERLQGYIDKWSTLIAGLGQDQEAQQAEQELLDQTGNGEGGIYALLDHAHTVLATLNTNARVLARMEDEIRTQAPQAPSAAARSAAKTKMDGEERLQAPAASVSEVPLTPNVPIATATPQLLALQRSTIQLPKLQLCNFNGNVTQWLQFWETFKASIDDQPLPLIHKMTYLLSTLKGEAKDAVAGYAITETNYPVVLEVLKRRFGNSDRIKFHLHQELHALPTARERTADVRKIFEQIESICRQLEALGDSANHPQVAIAIESKMPRWLLMRIYEEKVKEKDWPVTKLRQLIENELQIRERVAYVHNDMTGGGRRTPVMEQRTATSVFAVHNNERRLTCVFCKGSHWSNECTRVATRDARLKKIEELRLCPKCLRTGHNVKFCNSQRTCFFCKKEHNTALCPGKAEHQGPQRWGQRQRNGTPNRKPFTATEAVRSDVAPQQGPTLPSKAAVHHIYERSNDKAEEVLLLTKEVVLHNPDNPNQHYKTTAFFDTGSQLSFITNEVAKKLNLNPKKQEKLAISTFAADHPTETHTQKYEVNIQHNDGIMKMQVHSVERLTDHLIVPKEDTRKHKTTQLTGQKATPGVLIGADYFWEFVRTNGVHKLPSGFHQVDSKVGPMICGKGNLTTAMVVQQHKDAAKSKEETLEKFWTLEALGVLDNPAVEDDDIALQQFQKGIHTDGGRYVVKWPWKEEQPNLPSNYTLCVARLQSTLKKLQVQPELLQKYDGIMQEQLQQGIIEPVVDIEQHGGIVHYLPHHAVITPNKATTKIRIVYDASAKAYRGAKSLNECLYRGPMLLPDLCGMLLRFRTYNIAIIADVEKAFLQLGLDVKDRDAVRFLWLKHLNAPWSLENLQVYRFCRVPFGVISSPFLLAATIQHHLRQHNTKVATEIQHNVYADNILMEAATTEEAKNKCVESKTIFKGALMNLREFISNDPLINKEFADPGQKEIVKFLGVLWDTQKDTITAKIPPLDVKETTTKREVLQATASIYDPLGLLAPAILPAKKFIQELWQKGYNWDQELAPEEGLRWKELANSMRERTIQLPRMICQQTPEQGFEIHTFVDASAIAYAAAVYLKQKTMTEGIVKLIYAKSRLSPTTGLTIPRLELMAALIGTRVTKFVMQQLQKPVQAITLWSDSKCVLGWINSTSETLPKFISNRLQEIHTLKEANFRYVPTKDNPADIGSRGMTADELTNSSLWWHGPQWLREDSDKWPATPLVKVDDLGEDNVTEQETEVATSAANIMTVALISSQPQPTIFNFDRWSSWQKAVNTMSTVLWTLKCNVANHLKTPPSMFWQRLKEMKSEKNCAELMLLAEEELIRQVQRAHPPSPGEVEGLNIQTDNRGLFVCMGRLLNSDLPPETKQPLYLPRQARATTLLILHIHKEHFHSGMPHTLAQLRQRFWVPRGRATVKSTIHKNCMTCRKTTAKPYTLPLMPALPKERVTQADPFKHTGLDYLGPLVVRYKEERVKAWVCLFTCLVTRAIHLEYVTELTTDAFITAFRKFIARRGRPTIIISDNARHFQLADKTLNEIWSTTIADPAVLAYFARERICWKFIPELAPWHGGVYERMVGMVKKAYRAAVGRQLLTLEQLDLLLHEIEAVVNSRPLTYIGDDITEDNILRPIDFLVPRSRPGFPSLTEDDSDDNDYRIAPPNSREKLIASWKRSIATLDHFWQKWHNEYLVSLRERQQRAHRGPRSQAFVPPRVGEVVLIHDDIVPRGQWRLGKIEEVMHSTDEHIRVAKIRTATGNLLRRAISHLYPLEIDEDNHLNHKTDDTSCTETSTADRGRQALHDLSPNKDKLPAAQQRPPATQDTGQTRYNLRPRRRQVFFLLAIIMATLIRGSMARHCGAIAQGELIHVEKCVQRGLLIRRADNGTICSTSVQCPNGHMIGLTGSSYTQHCGPFCECPAWATSCSFYDGKSTLNSSVSHDKTNRLVQSQQPNICSRTPTKRCAPTKMMSLQNQIQLYDGTLHLVKELHLVTKDFLQEEYECVGDLNSTITGTSKFCDKHSCAPEGTQYCFYPQHDATFWTTDDGFVAIRAWGAVPIELYDFHSHLRHNDCPDCTIDCVKGGVRVTTMEGTDVVDVTSGAIKTTLTNPRIHEDVTLPAHLIVSTHTVHALLWSKGHLLATLQVTCAPSAYCEMIQCYFCKELVANPHCASKEAVVVLVVALYVASLLLFVVAKALKLLAGGLRFAYCCCTCLYKIWKKPRNHKTPKWGLPEKIAVAVCVILLQISPSYQCAETATITATEKQCMAKQQGQLSCTFEENTVLNLQPVGQQICLLLQGYNHQPAGTLKLEVNQVEVKCQKITKFYTRTFEVRVTTQKRCPIMGSCHGDRCATITPNETIPELGDANKLPGYTRCVESCSCWACECFICSPACMFYRVYAQPTTADVWEIYHCASWDTQLIINATMITSMGTTTHQFATEAGRTSTWNTIKLTLENLNLPPIPTLESTFATNGRITAVLDKLAEQAAEQLTCSTFDQARDLSCELQPDLCNCQPTGDRVNCLCRDTTAISEAIKNRNLPAVAGGVFWLHPDGSSVKATLPITAASIRVSIKDMTIVTQIDVDICKIEEMELKGCYDCESGAELTIKCRTDFGQAIAHVECASTTFHIDCSPQADKQSVRLRLDQPEINEPCHVTCPAASTTFQLKGTLYFIAKIQHSSHPNTWLGTITDTDIWPIVRRALFSDFSAIITTVSVILVCLILTIFLRIILGGRRRRYC